MEMLMSRIKDLRGSQSRIARLASFYLEGSMRMLFYRILAPLSIAYSALAFVLLPI